METPIKSECRRAPGTALPKRIEATLLSFARAALFLCVLLGGSIGFAKAQSPEPTSPAFTQQQLEQMLAPIALYPDSLLSQILMASTYPLEVVQAARWSRANPHLAGEAAVNAVAHKHWDPSVKSLVAFSQLLAMMDEKLEWTEKLGEAFLAQEPQVMDTVQSLRQRAYAAGSLRTTEQMYVSQQGPAIVIEPVSPQVVYVPYYDPWVIYGSWWWPAHPPVHWRPWVGYYVRPGITVGFFWGPPVRVSGGFFFGKFDWQRRVHGVSAHHYHTVNLMRRPSIADRHAVAATFPNDKIVVWKHDPAHRRGAPYRSQVERPRWNQSGVASVEPQRDRRPEERSMPSNHGTVAARSDLHPGGARPVMRGPEGRRDSGKDGMPPIQRVPGTALTDSARERRSDAATGVWWRAQAQNHDRADPANSAQGKSGPAQPRRERHRPGRDERR